MKLQIIAILLICLFIFGCTSTDTNTPINEINYENDTNLPQGNNLDPTGATTSQDLSTPEITNLPPSQIIIQWKNNPLDLKNGNIPSAELGLTLINNLKETTDITLEVTSESNKIIIFCPDTTFLNVATGNQPQTTCIVRRNPNEKVFSGNYIINIKTNLGTTKTTFEVITS